MNDYATKFTDHVDLFWILKRRAGCRELQRAAEGLHSTEGLDDKLEDGI